MGGGDSTIISVVPVAIVAPDGAAIEPVGVAAINSKSLSSGLEGRDCVPYFVNDRSQIKFEFAYLITTFVLAVAAILTLQLASPQLGLKYSDKLSLFSLLGGFLGGWVYDTKWFYRVTARGKSNQYGYPWQPHKFYWRIFTPFLAALVAFVTLMLALSDFIPIAVKHPESARSAFAISFILGYFSDLVLSRLAAWAEKVVPKVSPDEQKL